MAAKARRAIIIIDAISMIDMIDMVCWRFYGEGGWYAYRSVRC